MNGHEQIHPTTEHGNNGEVSQGFGLTKREYFAAMAMAGICGDGIVGDHHSAKNTAIYSVDYADALIKELNK